MKKEKELGSLISIQKIIILFFYIQRQPTYLFITINLYPLNQQTPFVDKQRTSASDFC